MSQRECAGFNWPPLSIPAEEPVSIPPVAVSRAGVLGGNRVAVSRSCNPPAPRAIRCSRGSAPVVSLLFGVGQPASTAPMHKSCGDPLRSTSDNVPSSVRMFFSPSAALHVGQPARCTATSASPICGSVGLRLPMIGGFDLASITDALGVGHPIVPVADVRRTDARRRERDTPEGVTQGFQVSVYKVDPRVNSFARNLLSKDACRATLCDEVVEGRPQVPLVSKPIAFACRAERLARTGAGPDWGVVADTGFTQGKAPDTKTGEKVALGISSKLIWSYIFDAPFVNNAGGNQALLNQNAKDGRGIRVVFVVVVLFHRGPH